MAIPDEVAQYAEGKHITSYFELGAVRDDIEPDRRDTTRIQIDGATFASLLAGIDFTASRKGWFRRLPSAEGIDSDRRM